jgi:HPt (histidine-containing phosphotransfer) domain-containing protein
MTASVMPGDQERCLEAGMDGHLAKPLDRVELLRAVEKVLESRPRRPRAPAPEPEPSVQAPLLDRETLEELRAAVGPGRLPRLISVFSAETKERVRRMHGMTDPARIEDEAHSLKASAATFGAIALRDAARKLEEACRAGDEAGWRDILDQLPGLAERSIAAFPQPRGERRGGGTLGEAGED